MSTVIHLPGLRAFQRGEVDLSGDVLKVALLGAGYTADQAVAYYSSISSGEVSGSGYTAGGKAITGTVVTLDEAQARVYLDADNTVWTESTVSARWGVLYDETASGVLLVSFDFGSLKESTNDDFSLLWAASGLVSFAQG